MTAKSGRFKVLAFLAVMVSLGLAACGDDAAEQTEAGIAWLKENHTMPQETGWILGDITAVGKQEITIKVDIDNITQAISFKALSAVDKGEVARLACPWPEAEFWGVAGAEMKAQILLQSMGSTIITATCRRP